ncbi:hypothetical protein COLO4_19078 [Corchorus olitorius]|uniref:DUF674 family protein n=1 Tax=Corchorus olitorius TaxID=93759 RepID=A0A1R3J6R6_9ROSI|nr:hypothetical protein COLO4_19078 [Corchorus olitorius]
MARIRLKALVDKKNNRVIFAESNEDFVDVLFSFLTIPMGTIIKLSRKHPPAANLGCMNNLYKSVENLEEERFQTKACRKMLLSPRNAAAAPCQNLKLNFDDLETLFYFHCAGSCLSSNYKLVSHYIDTVCDCGSRMGNWTYLVTRKDSDAEVGVFVKGMARLMVSDDLQVVPSSTAASFSILSKLGIIDGSATEVRSFHIGVNERSSKKPKLEAASNQNGKIVVRLMISKSKQMVCYAEASEDFVDLLFSFLTVPLGFIIKQMHGGDFKFKGCINRLFDSVQGLDAEQYLKSQENEELLISPKLAPVSPVTFLDPKSHDSHHKDKKSGRGFMMGPAQFTITDDLTVTAISSISGLTVLSNLKVPFGDIEERTVHVGENEALRLLVASFISKSALTNAFLLK